MIRAHGTGQGVGAHPTGPSLAGQEEPLCPARVCSSFPRGLFYTARPRHGSHMQDKRCCESEERSRSRRGEAAGCQPSPPSLAAPGDAGRDV